MKIYIGHSRSFDFKNELYKPLQESVLATKHQLVFPHSESSEPFSSKEFFQNGCDLIIAEVSYPATGLGIELGWADILKVPIICIYKNGSKVSGSLKAITDNFLEYSDEMDLIVKLEQKLNE